MSLTMSLSIIIKEVLDICEKFEDPELENTTKDEEDVMTYTSVTFDITEISEPAPYHRRQEYNIQAFRTTAEVDHI